MPKSYEKPGNLQDFRVFTGTPKGTRTPDLLIRSQSLYPTELSAHRRFPQAPVYISTEVSKKQALFSEKRKNFLFSSPASALFAIGEDQNRRQGQHQRPKAKHSGA